MRAMSNSRSYCSLVTFREVFFVNKVHRKPESCGALYFISLSSKKFVRKTDMVVNLIHRQ